jgi:hypothetical protein
LIESVSRELPRLSRLTRKLAAIGTDVFTGDINERLRLVLRRIEQVEHILCFRSAGFRVLRHSFGDRLDSLAFYSRRAEAARYPVVNWRRDAIGYRCARSTDRRSYGGTSTRCS